MVNEKEIDDWLRAINDEERIDRESIIRKLELQWEKSDKIIPLLIKSLSIIKDKKVRLAILGMLQRINRIAKFPIDILLDIIIFDEDFGIKASTFYVVIEKITLDSLEILNKHLIDSNLDDETLGLVIDLTGKLGKEADKSADLLYSIFNSRSDVNVKSKAIRAIGSVACDKYYSELINIIDNEENKFIRNAATESLRNLKEISDEIIDSILTLLQKEKSDIVKKTFFSTLSIIGIPYKEKIIPILIKFTKEDEDVNTRKNAVFFGYKMDKDNFPILIIHELEQEFRASKKKNIYSALDPLVKELGCKNKEELIRVYRKEGSSKISMFDKNPNNKLVFIIMAFKPDMEPVYDCLKEVAEEYDLIAKRVDEELGDYKITDKIIEMIEDCKFIIADLTHERPNVYFELGYARGIGKTVITIAKDTTKIHFDVKDWKYLSYNDTRVLEKKLRREIDHILKN